MYFFISRFHQESIKQTVLFEEILMSPNQNFDDLNHKISLIKHWPSEIDISQLSAQLRVKLIVLIHIYCI